MDFANLRFQDPLWLWALLAPPLVVLAAWLRERGGVRALAFPGPHGQARRGAAVCYRSAAHPTGAFHVLDLGRCHPSHERPDSGSDSHAGP